jgi:hypothetical protein
MPIEISEKQRQRGYVAQARFFKEMGRYRGRRKPHWFYKAVEADPYIDHRGIDGFIFVWTFLFFYKKIPIQLKTDSRQMDYEISKDKPVHILIHFQMEPEVMMHNLKNRVGLALKIDFRSYIKSTTEPPIAECREKYK